MARKNVLKSFKMLDAEDISISSTSAVTSVINLDKASISISWNGASPAGTIELKARNGEDDAWQTIPFSTPITVSGNSGDHRIVLNELPFTDIRLDYTATSGTGAMDAIITAKQTGG